MPTPTVDQRKVVLIPGAARPVGRAIARRFAAAGLRLVLPWLDWPESVAEMDEEFARAGVETLSCRCDLRDPDAVAALMTAIEQRFTRLDYLINNIERGGMPAVHGSYDQPHNQQQWQLEFDTTVRAKYHLFTKALPLLRIHGGAVLNLSSIAGYCGRSGPAACFFSDGYSAANRAIRSLTESWARQGAPEVRVNELMLGLISSRHGDNTRGWEAISPLQRQQLHDHTLLGRLGTPQEVADFCYFLAVESTFMTGAVVAMDGGYLLGGDRVPPMPPGIL